MSLITLYRKGGYKVNIFKRVFTQISAGYDSFMMDIENHEALAESAIREGRKAAVQARIRLKHIEEDLTRLNARCNSLREEESKWLKRVKKVEEEDEATALECARRIKRIRIEVKTLEEQADDHQQLVNRLKEDIHKIDDRLNLLKRKKNTLAARSSRAGAMKNIAGREEVLFHDVDDIFSKWEHKVLGEEITSECTLNDSDHFTADFEDDEEKQELQLLLQEIRKEGEST